MKILTLFYILKTVISRNYNLYIIMSQKQNGTKNYTTIWKTFINFNEVQKNKDNTAKSVMKYT